MGRCAAIRLSVLMISPDASISRCSGAPSRLETGTLARDEPADGRRGRRHEFNEIQGDLRHDFLDLGTKPRAVLQSEVHRKGETSFPSLPDALDPQASASPSKSDRTCAKRGHRKDLEILGSQGALWSQLNGGIRKIRRDERLTLCGSRRRSPRRAR